ncbi:MAG: septation protein SepH [Actinomycetes bacterium]
MTDLRLVAVTPERSHLVLEDDDSNQFRVPIDERLAGALRAGQPARPGNPRHGQLEIALESQLSPREIQARVRSGHSAEEVATAAGTSVDRIERYAAPVLAEREHVVELAQAAPARRASGGSAPALGVLVESRLAEEAVASDSVRWDAWRCEDNRWTVHLTYLGGGKERVAQWSFDPRGRVLAPADDESRRLVDEARPQRGEEAPAARQRRLASVPAVAGDGRAAVADPADQVYDHQADPGRPPDAPEQPARQVARAGRRPAIPSWDDIMFGTRRRD